MCQKRFKEILNFLCWPKEAFIFTYIFIFIFNLKMLTASSINPNSNISYFVHYWLPKWKQKPSKMFKTSIIYGTPEIILNVSFTPFFTLNLFAYSQIFRSNGSGGLTFCPQVHTWHETRVTSTMAAHFGATKCPGKTSRNIFFWHHSKQRPGVEL